MRSPRFLFACLLSSFAALLGSPAYAQINPDKTLGVEASMVTPDVVVRGGRAELIEGGAIRGGNLFHSFSDFNVLETERVYFASPVGVDSILSRVTGNDLSNIFGTLGVDGAADLFLINPNGIVFGSGVNLDVQGSLYATTAEAVSLGGGVFSATAPEQSQLLVVTPNTSFFNYLTADSGDIVNRGQIGAGGDVALAANNLDLQGQIVAGEDLSLLAADTIQIRDATATPFVAFAGDDLLVQGNQEISIVALSHPESGLFSYGDMALRSDTPVGGDAHYFSGGSFRVENLDESSGNLFSPIDPIIRAYGNVAIEGYKGTSLHVLAGGSVFLGTAIIDNPDVGAIGVDFLEENIQLSDGTVIAVNGAIQPTLDVRAGVSVEALGFPSLRILSGQNPMTDFFLNVRASTVPSEANIVIGDVIINESNGLVLLTNKYRPNAALLGGNIVVTGDGVYGVGINASSLRGMGGTVSLDSRNNIAFIGSAVNTASPELAGNITLLANDSIVFDGADGTRPSGTYSNILSIGEGAGGTTRLAANNVGIFNGAQLNAINFGRGDSGSVNVYATETALFDGSNPINGDPSGVFSGIGSEGEGKGGDIQITATNLAVINGARLLTEIVGRGNAGNVILNASDNALFSGINAVNGNIGGAFSFVQENGSGKGGNVQITANNLVVNYGARLGSDIIGSGEAGNVILDVVETVRFENEGLATSINSSTKQGQSGDINITASNLYVSDGSRLSTSSTGNGSAGDIVIAVRDTAHFEDSTSAAISSIELGGEGDSGDIQITATNLEVLDGAQLITSVFGRGTAGNIILNISDTVRLEDTRELIPNEPLTSINSGVEGSEGVGGDIRITATNLRLINGGQISAGASENGSAGNIVLNIFNTALFEGINSVNDDPDSIIRSGVFNDTGSSGNQNGVKILARNLFILDGAGISSSVQGAGNAGDIFLDIGENIIFDGVNILNGNPSSALSIVAAGAEGESGDIRITASNLSVLNGALISNALAGTGNGGKIVLDVNESTLLEGFSSFDDRGSKISSSIGSSGSGQAGDIRIRTGQLEILNGAQLLSSVFSTGNAGNVIIEADDRIRLEGLGSNSNSPAAISSGTLGGEGSGGNILITARDLEILHNAQIASNADGVGNSGNISLNIENMLRLNAASSESDGHSTISSGVDNGEGRGGDINITAGNLEVLNGAQIISGNFSRGNSGNIFIDVRETALFDGEGSVGEGYSSGAFSSIFREAEGNGGDIAISASSIVVSNAATIDARSLGRGSSGNISLNARESIVFDITRPSPGGRIGGAANDIGPTGNGQGGNLQITSPHISILNGSQIGTSTLGLGNAGNVLLEGETIVIDGFEPFGAGRSSGVFSSVQPTGRGRGGVIRILATDLSIANNAVLSAESLGQGNAGSLSIEVKNRLQAQNGNITTTSRTGAGGQIRIAANSVVLQGDSDIQTFVNSGDNNGGNITIASNALIMLDDSDILAFSTDGEGGDIDLTQTTLFSNPLNPISGNLTSNELASLDGNNRVDINATGGTNSGKISTNNNNLIENDLAELPDNLVNSENLVANSCIARSENNDGTLTLTGRDRLPQTPNEALTNLYPAGTVSTVPTDNTNPASITEPQAVYQLADGRLIMSRDCES